MKRIILGILVIFSAVFFGESAFAEGLELGQESIAEALPDGARDILENADITPDNSGALGLSFGEALSQIRDIFKDEAIRPLKMFCALCGVILLSVLAESLADSGNLKGVFSAVGALCAAGIVAATLSEILSETLGMLSAAANFTLIFIPVFTGISAVLGHVSTAFAVNSAVLAATQLFSQLAVNFLAPLCGSILGVSAAGAAHPQLKLDKLGEIIKKIVTIGLTLIMTVFVSVLSTQTLVAAAADNTAIKTAKFALSQGVPIVGSAVSDTVNTLSGGIAMLKSSVGTYGMIAAAAIMLPTLASLTCYRLALFFAQSTAEMFGLKELGTLFKSCCSVMTIILAVTVCFLIMNSLAVFIMLALTGSV